MTPETATLTLQPGRAGMAAVPAVPPVRLSATPHSDRGLVPRPRLVRRLSEVEVPIAVITAPAGYGKTTLLADWAARDPRPFARLPDAVGKEPQALREAIASALSGGERSVLVIDDADRVVAPGAIRELADVALGLAPGSTVALASRSRLALPIGRLRAHRLAVEVGRRELAMTRLEAAMLLDAAGLRLDGDQVDRLLERTEGWPAALYLAATALREEADPDAALAGFDGTDRLVADYLRTDVLARLAPEEIRFLRRTSIVPLLTAPLCNAVLCARDSDAALERLAAASALVEPLNRAATELRRHPLLTGLLRAELGVSEPDLVPVLHRRASDWYARHGHPSQAVEHAIAGGDREHAGRLLWSQAPAWAGEGRGEHIGERLGTFTASDLSAHPTLALTAATHHLAEGRRDECERWTETAARRVTSRHELAAAVALLRACVAQRGVMRMAEDAAHASDLMAPSDPWQSLARCLEGVARHLTGDREAAGDMLEEAARRATGHLPLVAALSHAQLAMLDGELGDADGAALHAFAARAGLDDVAPETPLRALVLAATAAVAADGGDLIRARDDAAEAGRRLLGLTGFTPWFLAESQIWLARAQIRLCDAATARVLLSRAARLQCRAKDAQVLWAWLHDGWERADVFAAGTTGDGPALTTAELRVLRFLPSHMSFREIGVRLRVSPNTVKTHALSVYRKLDVSCRSDAVARARLVGLVDA